MGDNALEWYMQRIRDLEKERDDADRRAGAAERKCEDFADTVARRNEWLSKAKREWGVDDRVSFDVVWKEALALKANGASPTGEGDPNG